MGWWSRLWRGSNDGAVRVRRTAPPISWPTPDDTGFTRVSAFVSSGSLQSLYECCSWSYACISANATEAASLGAVVQRRAAGKWIPDPSHDLNALLQFPSGDASKEKQWTWRKLLAMSIAHQQLEGNSYLFPRLVREGKRIYSVEPIIPSYVTVVTDPLTLYPTKYYVGGDAYDPEQIVHTTYPSPYSFSTGAAPIRAAIRAIGIDYAADSRTAYNLQNKVAPGLIFQQAGLMGMTADKRDELMDFLNENYAGSAKDGTPMVFGEGLTITPTPSSRAERGDYQALRDAARSEILSVFHVPPPAVGVYDDATLNNFATAFKLWWLGALFPILANTYDDINTQLVHPVYGPNVRLWYDDTDSEIGLLLLDARVATAQRFVDMGFPPNAAADRMRLGMQHVPELDKPLQNLAVAGRQ